MLKKLFCRLTSTGLYKFGCGTRRRLAGLARVEQLEVRLVLSGVTFTQFSAGLAPYVVPSAITAGPDGNVWFTERSTTGTDGLTSSRVGRISPSGTITEINTGNPDSLPLTGIATGSDGNLWVTTTDGMTSTGRILRITPGGTVTKFSTGITANSLGAIAAGPDGNLWFVEFNSTTGAGIGRITPNGAVTEFSKGITANRLGGITACPDGNVWFTADQDHIYRITPSGTITEFNTSLARFSNITAGADGNLWFAGQGIYYDDVIGRITPSGTVTQFGATAYDITMGPDGNVWFPSVDSGGTASLSQITPSGTITRFGLSGNTFLNPEFSPSTGQIITGPDGNLWFLARVDTGVDSVVVFQRAVIAQQASAITSTNAATFTTGVPGTFTVTASGFPAPTLTETGALPIGVTFNPATGVLSGTPATGTAGTFPLTFTATSAAGGPITQAFTLTVNAGPTRAAAITSPDAATFTTVSAGTFTVTATGIPMPTLSVTGDLPTGVTFNPFTGVLSSTPSAGIAGTYPLTFTATNGVGIPATQSFTLIVTSGLTITQFNAGISPNSFPTSITAGPDGNVWFTEGQTGQLGGPSRIGRITPSGIITEYSTGITANTHLGGITAGYDGNLWFTETDNSLTGGRIGRITPTGVVTEFSTGITGISLGGIVSAIELGVGAPTSFHLFFTEQTATGSVIIGQMNGDGPAIGGVTEFSMGATGTVANGIALGPEGNIWFTEVSNSGAVSSGKVGRLNNANYTYGTITEFSMGITANSAPGSMTVDTDGNLWFAGNTFNGSSSTGNVGRVTPNGTITQFNLGVTAQTHGITTGPDGNVWFTNGNSVGAGNLCQVTPSGTITEFNVGSFAGPITEGPDGSLWFGTTTGIARAVIGRPPTFTHFNVRPTEDFTAGPDGNFWSVKNSSLNNQLGVIGPSQIVRITLDGTVTEFSTGITPNSLLAGITGGPDGNVWFTEENASRIGRITPSGIITEFSVGITANMSLSGITAGPDGNIWFIETPLGTSELSGRIGRITPDGTVTEFSAGISGRYLGAITAGPDGNVWFTESGVNNQANAIRIGRITPAGTVTEFSTGISGTGLGAITTGLDGNVWFTEQIGPGYAIGRITPAGAVAEFSTTNIVGGITTGPDGNLWYTTSASSRYDYVPGRSKLGRISPSGTITEFNVPPYAPPAIQDSQGGKIITGPDGNLWFNSLRRAVPAQQAPAITSVNSTTFTTGTAGTFMVRATGFPASALSQTGALPAGVTFNAATGVLSGTPAPGTSGSFAINFIASNGVDNPAIQNFTLTVNPPTTLAPRLTIASAGNPLSQTVLFFSGGDHQVYVEKLDADQNVVSPPRVVQEGASGSNLTAVTPPNGAPLLFLIGGDNQVYEAKFDAAGNVTSGFALTQAGAIKSMTATTDAADNPILLVIGNDNQVYFQRFDAAGTQTAGYALVSAGAVQGISADGPVLFAQGLDNQIYESQFNGTAWVAYHLSSPGAVLSFTYSAAAGQLLAIGSDNQLYAQKIDAAGNSDGWFLTSPGGIKAMTQGVYGGKAEAFVIGGDDQLYAQPFDATGKSLGYAATRPGAVKSIYGSRLPGSPAVFAVGGDNQVYLLKFDEVTGAVVGEFTSVGSGAVT